MYNGKRAQYLWHLMLNGSALMRILLSALHASSSPAFPTATAYSHASDSHHGAADTAMPPLGLAYTSPPFFVPMLVLSSHVSTEVSMSVLTQACEY
eukprot:2000566-Rhodomonas_salina.2